MVSHIMPRRHLKRDIDPNTTPTANGFSGAVTATGTTPTQTNGLALDPDGGSASISAPNIGPSAAVTTITSSLSSTESAQPSASETAAVSAAHSSISMGTVIGACVGAAIGAIGLIGLGFIVYRRYSASLKARARTTRRAWPGTRNTDNDTARRRSHLEPWNKLEEGDDKWEGMYQNKEDNVAPMEKLTMFKKSPSVRTAWTHKSNDEPVEFDSNMFAQYHPQLAQELASADKSVEKKPSIVNVRSMSGDSMNSASPAIPTPLAVHSTPHHWESAEVLHFEPEEISETKPELEEEKILTEKNILERRRTSQHNPFFGASHNRERTSVSRSRSNSLSKPSPAATSPIAVTPSLPTVVTPATPKGKEREITAEDPFADRTSSLPELKRPFAASHAPSGSTSSTESQERALKSLIAALDGADISEADVQERLRVASMQPSIVSQTSVYTEADEEELTRNFPLPPSSRVSPQ